MNTLILFNFSPDRVLEIAPCARECGFRLRPAAAGEQRVPILSISGPAPADPLTQPAFREEMMLFSCPGNDAVFAFLAHLREKGIRSPSLKAVVTAHNCRWTPEKLYRELKAERDSLSGGTSGK